MKARTTWQSVEQVKSLPYDLAANRTVFRVVIAVLLSLILDSVVGQSTRSDRHALNAVFAEQHVEDTALHVHLRAMSMRVEERYAFLSDWILPGIDHQTLRMQVGFSQTHPPPLMKVSRASEPARHSKRSGTGGELISPVFDLLDAAKKLDRLDEVHDRVSGWDVDEQHRGRLSQAAMLTLIDLARGDAESASTNLDELLQITSSEVSAANGPTSAELLVFHRGLEQPSIRDATGEGVERYRTWVTSEYYRSTRHHHVAKMLGRVRTVKLQVRGMAATPITVTPMK